MDQKVIVLRGTDTATIVETLKDSAKNIVLLKESDVKDSLIAELEILLVNGSTVIVEGLFQEPRILEQILSASAALGVPCLVFEIGILDLPRKDAIKIDIEKYSIEECKNIILETYKDWDKEKPYSEGAFVFFIKDQKILMSLTSYNPELQLYSGYGGGVDEDETPEEAVVREAKEEADVVVKQEDLRKVAILTRITKQIPENTQSVFKLTIFLSDKWEGEVKDLPGMKSTWFDFNKLPFDQMFPDNKIVLPMVLEGKCVEMNSVYIKKGDGERELINRDIREVKKLD